MSEERKVPKIVLKFGLNQKVSTAPTVANDSIFSAKASEIVKEKEGTTKRIPAISLDALVKKTNQGIYRSLENFLELSGRMNDIERKKALFQVLSRVKAHYFSLHLLSEWTKISSTHLLLKTYLAEAVDIQNRLNGSNTCLGGFYEHSQASALPNPKYTFTKDLNCAESKIPCFFAYSIANMSFEAKTKKVVGTDEDWTKSLEALLCLEVCKNMIDSKENVKLESIEKSKCVFVVSSLFVFELTLVPFEGKAAWFILNVEGSKEFKNLFNNGLTGIFQARYNNKLCSEFNLFNSVVLDCSKSKKGLDSAITVFLEKYVDLFFFEKLFSEFSFLTTLHGRQNLAFYHDGKSKSFQIKPWFMKSTFSIGFSHIDGFEVASDFRSFFLPKLTFDSNEAVTVLTQLFEVEFGSKVSSLLESLYRYRLVGSSEKISQSCFRLTIFENFHVVLTLKPVERGVDVKISSGLDEIGSLCSQIETAILDLDLNRLSALFIIINTRALQQLFDNSADFNCIECIGVSDSTTLILAKRGSQALIKVALQSEGKLYLSRLHSSMKPFKGILSFEFTDGSPAGFPIPHVQEQLFDLISSFSTQFSESNSHNELSDMVAYLGLKGEFESSNSFMIFSHGLPTLLKSAVLVQEGSSKFYLAFNTDLNTYSRPVDTRNFGKLLTNSVKIFWIHEALIQFGMEAAISSDMTLQVSVKSGAFDIKLNESCDLAALGPLKQELESILNAKEFNIYSLFEFLNSPS